jgi:cytoskeletal protein RodZ
MSAPTLDRQPGSSQSGGRRRHRQLVLVASAVAALVIALGVSLAIATNPADRQVPAEAGAVPAAAADDQNANVGQGQTAQPDQEAPTAPAESSSDPGPAASDGAAPTLDDGDHPAYITKVDGASNRIVIDVVQVFHDDAAVKAAIADGEPSSKARYLTGWVRNQNPRLRTLPLAGDLKVDLLGSCEETGNDRQAVLTRLAEHAKRKGNYYFSLTVDDGKVERIQERLAINAC